MISRPRQTAVDAHDPDAVGNDGPQEGTGPDLDKDDQQKAKDEESLNASVTYEVIRREGEKELARSPQALAWSGLAAGLSMGFILVAEGVLRSHLPEATWRPLVAKLGYSVGFLIVMLGSQQLYTENTLTPIVPLLSRKSGEMLGRVLRLWAIVLVTNLLGTSVFAWVLARTTLFDPEVHSLPARGIDGSGVPRRARDGDMGRLLRPFRRPDARREYVRWCDAGGRPQPCAGRGREVTCSG